MTTLRSVTATAPSNIAFIKYWGKRDPQKQWPANDSLSMTLSDSRTITTAAPSGTEFDTFLFAGKKIDSRANPEHKIFRHLNLLRAATNTSTRLSIESSNTFPTGCGIASSASGFAALTLAATGALTGSSSLRELNERVFPLSKLADLARMGSGSAGRSLFGGYVEWKAGVDPSSQVLAPVFGPDHWALSDIIVVLSPEEKSVSSSEAHLAAWGSPLFSTRLSGIPERLKALREALKIRDIERLGTIIECDALEMHAVAMTGTPPVCYFTEQTRELLSWVRQERSQGLLPAWFTVDAGPNVHLICLPQDADQIVRRLKKAWPKATIIADKTGSGPDLRTTDGIERQSAQPRGIGHV